MLAPRRAGPMLAPPPFLLIKKCSRGPPSMTRDCTITFILMCLTGMVACGGGDLHKAGNMPAPP
eukprot:2462731-Pyramimonas_sp.AAC.1